MASDYYSYLAETIAGLANNTPQDRADLYERARLMLSSRLRAAHPPYPPDIIASTEASFDAAIQRIEAEQPATAPQAAASHARPQPATARAPIAPTTSASKRTSKRGLPFGAEAGVGEDHHGKRRQNLAVDVGQPGAHHHH